MSALNTANPQSESPRSNGSRRQFLKSGALAGMAGTLLASRLPQAYASGSDTIRVGLVGCGDRGTGAANQALLADPQARLVAMGDAFPDAIESKLRVLQKQKAIGEQIDVPQENRFAGLDAYRKVIDACDVVLLASPPGFRPLHLAYAVEQGKHIFAEKPMATDSPGLRSVIESVKIAKEKKLSLVSGFCWRYDEPRAEFFNRILSGEAGDVLCVLATYLTNPVKPMPPASSRPAGMTDVEWMVHNWYNFTWLSGDGLVEQAIHSVDWVGWAMGDTLPVSCVAVGGRQIPANGGDIYDHISVNYLWENGSRGIVQQRQMKGCYNDNSCHILGSAGQGMFNRKDVSITGPHAWKRPGTGGDNMYEVEHRVLFKSVRDGSAVNDGDRMVNSNLLGLMGRMSGYTGKEVTPQMVLESTEELVPANLTWNTPVQLGSPPLPGLSSLS